MTYIKSYAVILLASMLVSGSAFCAFENLKDLNKEFKVINGRLKSSAEKLTFKSSYKFREYKISEKVVVDFNKDKYKNVYGQYLGVSLKISNKVKGTINIAGPINLDSFPVKQIVRAGSDKYGVGIAFLHNKLFLLFKNEKKRNQFYNILIKHKELLNRRSYLFKQIKRLTLREMGILKHKDMTSSLISAGKLLTSISIPYRGNEYNYKNFADSLFESDNSNGTFPVVRPIDRDLEIEIAPLSGKESLALRLKSLRDAKLKVPSTIKVQTLHWNADEAGMLLAERLIELRKMGHNVIVYLDTLSPFIDIRDVKRKLRTRSMYNKMMAAGIPVYGHVCGYAPFFRMQTKEFRDAMKRAYKEDSSTRLEFRKKVHDKIWIVNNSLAIVGGMNITNEYFEVATESSSFWRDQDFAIKGDLAVYNLGIAFNKNVESFLKYHPKYHPVRQSCYNPNIPGTAEYKRFYNERINSNDLPSTPKNWSKKMRGYFLYRYFGLDSEFPSKYSSEELKRLDNELLGIVDESGRIVNGRLEKLDIDFRPVSEFRVVSSKPIEGELHIENTYIDLINSSKEEIWIMNSYYIPSNRVLNALKNAAKRGVQVNILSNDTKTNDLGVVMIPAQRYYYKDLMDVANKNVHIFEWTGKDKFREFAEVRGMMHAKVGIFDREVVFGGSYNLDYISREGNSEINIAFKSKEIASSMVKKIIQDDLPICREVSYSETLDYKFPTDSFLKKMILKLSLLIEKSL